jgi:hypothetical protein
MRYLLAGVLMVVAGSCRAGIEPIRASYGEDSSPPGNEKPTVEQLIATLAHGGAADRMEAAHRIGLMQSKTAVPALIASLRDPKQDVRSWCAWALGEIGDEAGIDPLIEAMEKYSALVLTDHLREQTGCIEDFAAALHKLSGRDLGFDAARWRKWRADQIKEKTAKDK